MEQRRFLIPGTICGIDADEMCQLLHNVRHLPRGLAGGSFSYSAEVHCMFIPYSISSACESVKSFELGSLPASRVHGRHFAFLL